MPIPGIKSKPTYEPLRADTRGRFHLMLGLGPGADALLRVLDALKEAAPDALDRATVLFAAGTPCPAPAVRAAHAATLSELGTAACIERLRCSGAAAFRTYPDAAALLAEFRTVLDDCLMGTRVYLAGPEGFIGPALRIALDFNLNKDEIRAEALGSLSRRLYCVHCRTITEAVRTNIAQCDGCGRWLLVRDHYSRRLAAYMGVMADAEAPGELPEIREVFA